MPRHKKSDPRQLPLLYDKTSDGVLALRTIDWRTTTLSRHRWRQVRELLAAVLWCGAVDGCRASVNRLMEVMNNNRRQPIVRSRRAFFRVRSAAVELGLVLCEQGYSDGGATFSERAVDLAAVAKLVEATRALARQSRAAGADRRRESQSEKNGTHLALTWHSSSLYLKPSKPQKHPVDASQRDEQLRCDDRGLKELDAATIRGIAERVVSRVGRRQSRGDWELALKAASLSATLGERWLWDAVAAVQHRQPPPSRPYGYLHRCLAEGAANLGVKFNRALAGVALDLELFVDEPRRSPRLCTSGEGVGETSL